jgi:hypothetical protein
VNGRLPLEADFPRTPDDGEDVDVAGEVAAAGADDDAGAAFVDEW